MNKDLLNSMKISGIVGLVFGLLFTLYLVNQSYLTANKVFFSFLIILASFSFSVFSAALSFLLDKKLKDIKFENSMHRNIINYLVIIALVIIIVSILSTLFSDYIEFRIPLEIGVIAAFMGFIIGFVIMYLDYKNYQTQQKLVLLEQENMFLNEIAYKDNLYQETVRNLVLTEERNRMAKELHDSIAQGIHGINYSIRAIRELSKTNEEVTDVINNMEEITKRTLEELRAVIIELQPTDLEKKGLVKAIQSILDLSHSLHNIDFSFHYDYFNNLTANQEMAAFRVAQEAITNIERHSGANKVMINLVLIDGNVKLSINDNGKGFDIKSEKSGFGLMNMQERVKQTGGNFNIESNDKGTSINVIW